MDITTFTKTSGLFLKSEEVKKYPNAPLIIINEPKLIDTEFEGKKSQKLRIEGEFNQEARLFDMSKTNARIVEKALGSDTSKWIGKQLFLSIYQTMSSKGKLVDAILIRDVK